MTKPRAPRTAKTSKPSRPRAKAPVERMARPSGGGVISLGVVKIAFKLFPAASSHSVSFNNVHKTCGSRVKQQNVCPVENVVLERADIAKGYEYEKEKYVQFTEEELRALEGERADRIDILEFVPAHTVDFIHVEKTHYLGVGEKGARAYRVLADVLKEKRRMAVGRWATRGREQLVLIRPYRDGFVLHQVYYGDEVRDFDEIDKPEKIHLDPAEANVANELVDRMTVARFDASRHRDEYTARVIAAVAEKVAGRPVEVTPSPETAEVADLFEALTKTLESVPANETTVGEDLDGQPVLAKVASSEGPPSDEPKSVRKTEPQEEPADEAAS
jgi:DNA end-binding protein Ku